METQIVRLWPIVPDTCPLCEANLRKNQTVLKGDRLPPTRAAEYICGCVIRSDIDLIAGSCALRLRGCGNAFAKDDVARPNEHWRGTLHGEALIFPTDKVGFYGWPDWSSLVGNLRVEEIKRRCLKAANDGRGTYDHPGILVYETKEGKLWRPQMMPLSIRVHDLRNPAQAPKNIEAALPAPPMADTINVLKALDARYLSALTVEEFHAMVDEDLPKLAEIGWELYGTKAPLAQ